MPAAEPPHGLVTGEVTDGATSPPIEGATVVLTTSVPPAQNLGPNAKKRTIHADRREPPRV